MPFPFVYLCDLLDDLERPHVSRYPMLPKDLANYTKDKVIRWLRLHRDRLNAFSTDSKTVMSMLQPENQTDRAYGLDPGSLELVIARALQLPRQHYLDLEKWKTEPVRGDLGACVKRVMENMDTMATPGQANSVTAEEINQSLLRIAAFDKRSSPAVQSLASSWSDPDGIELLINLYQRLKGREAKWLTRLILKSYAPIKFPDNLEPGPQHSFLPACVQLKLQFPRASAPPVRRDGARVIIGIGSNDSSIGLSTPSRTAQQSSSPALPLITSADQPPPTPTASFPQPASSAPAPSLILSHPASSTPASLMLTLSVSAALRTLSTPVSSLPIPTPTVQHTRCSTLISTPSSHLVARASPHNHPSTPSRTALGPISHNIPTSSPKRSPMRSSPGLSIFTGGSGTCRWTPHTCPLSTCVFVLGPCIAKVPYINEQLLGWHGSRFTTSIRALAHPSLQRRCSRTGRRFKKIALVESHCTQPTVDFLKRISSLNLMRKGKKELIEVYDWRLLECITKMDQGKQLTYDPWARCWICNI